MAEIKNNTLPNSFSEAVCIDAGRVYDSCCDRDCLEDLRCFFTPRAQEIVDQAMTVRIRSAEVIDVVVDVEPITFNRGFYSCDLTFFFLIELDVFSGPHSKPCAVRGVCIFDKKVILYGSKGNVKVFSNEFALAEEADRQVRPTTNLPKCVVQTVDPVPLGAKLSEVKDCYEHVRCIPNCVCERLGGDINLNQQSGDKTVYVTLGLFTIVQLVRNVQMLVPVYDFCIPEKQCDDSIDPINPCDIFKKIKFPTEDFFPPRADRPNECFSCDSDEEDKK